MKAWTGGGAALVAGVAAALSLGGCATLPAEDAVANVGDVQAALVMPPPGAVRLEMESTQRFVYPNLVAPAAMPGYPPELLPLRLDPVQLCVEVDIDEQGTVFAARSRTDADCPAVAEAYAHAFADATLRAVRDWRFEPAYVCQAPEGFALEDPCAADGMVEHPTRLRLSYAFRFSQHDGRPLVERADGG